MTSLTILCDIYEAKTGGEFLNASENHSDVDPYDEMFERVNSVKPGLIDELCSNLKQGKNSSTVTGFTKYSYPPLLLFGLFGNALTFLVMCRVHSRKRNFQKFSLSLGTLALGDIAVLLFGCLIDYLEGS